MSTEYLSNKEVERLAIQAAQRHEKKEGRVRSVREVRRASKGSGYDLVSGSRRIEVKGTQGSRVGQQLYVSSQAELDNLKRGGWLYRVTGVGSHHPVVHEIAGNALRFVPEPRWRVTPKRK